ncbi:unnamed protein product [Prunus armeniaca]|uniref:RNase H type-1 domain-containing protein n=1 Tax=Prunus armeniaca TaxID=36596 RepID=A0A6J5U6Y9_PRUAR|nr:unnamed protein product [Prunus armeniaca]
MADALRDSKILIDSLREGSCPDANAERILHDIRILSQQFTSICFSFGPRTCNIAVHTMARVSKFSGACNWDSLTPPLCLFSSLEKEAAGLATLNN